MSNQSHQLIAKEQIAKWLSAWDATVKIIKHFSFNASLCVAAIEYLISICIVDYVLFDDEKLFSPIKIKRAERPSDNC